MRRIPVFVKKRNDVTPKTPPACRSPERENLASLNLTLVLAIAIAALSEKYQLDMPG